MKRTKKLRRRKQPRPHPTIESPFLTAEELATRWHVSHDTIQTMRLKGTGPLWVQLMPRRYLYRKSDVEAWELKQRKKIVMPLARRGRAESNHTGHPPPSKVCRNNAARERFIAELEGNVIPGDEE